MMRPKTTITSLLLASLALFLFAQCGKKATEPDENETSQPLSWQSAGLHNRIVYSLIAVSGDFVLAGTDSGDYRTFNGGTTWTKGTLQPVATFLISGPAGKIYATTTSGFYLTSDSGKTWFPQNGGLSFPAPSMSSITTKPTNIIFCGGSGGIWKTTNEGQNWANSGMTSSSVTALTGNAAGHLFAGARDDGIYRSMDNGASWQQVASIGYTPWFFSVTSSYVAATVGGAYRSTDQGANWVTANTGLTNTTTYTVVEGSNGNLFLGTALGGLYQSTNGGQSWNLENTGLPQQDIYFLAISGGNIYAGTKGSGVYRAIN